MSEMETRRAQRWPYAAGAIGILITVAAAIWILGVRDLSATEAAAWLRSVGDRWWSPLAYGALYALFSVVMIPPVPLSVAGAVMWGWLLGGAIELVVFTLSSTIAYLLARSTLGHWLQSRIPERARKLEERIHREGFMILILLRLIPVIPSPLLNYTAGLARIPLLQYIAATFIGSIPAVFIFTYLVDSVAAAAIDISGAFVRVVIAGVTIAGFLLITRRLRRIFRRGDSALIDVDQPDSQPPGIATPSRSGNE
jgi:uncharacterized membrane protein YdjX (TVP38/TMEM64 family)